MAKADVLWDEDVRLLASLWRELAEVPAAQADVALHHCLTRLASYVGACNASWVVSQCLVAPGSAQDKVRGWRVRLAEHLHCRDERQQMARRLMKAMAEGERDPFVAAIVSNSGQTRSALRRDLLEETVWQQSWIVREALAGECINDRLVGSFSATPGCEAHLVLDRRRGERPFGERERAMLELFMHGSVAFQREQLLVRGLLDARAALSARERDVLVLLLSDASEKDIAQELGLGTRTVHQHAVRLYAKFGVRGRIGLMALWLRQAARI